MMGTMSYGDISPEDQAEIDRLVAMIRNDSALSITDKARTSFLELRGYSRGLEHLGVEKADIDDLNEGIDAVVRALVTIRKTLDEKAAGN